MRLHHTPNDDNNDILYDDDDDDDDEPPSVDIANFQAPTASFGWHRGRSAGTVRQGVGLRRDSTAKVFLCTACGAELVKWMGKCPTCRAWNTLQEHAVTRQVNSPGVMGGSRPSFGGSSSSLGDSRPSSSWVGMEENDAARGPQRLTDILQQQAGQGPARVTIPDDAELTTVLGGGVVPGSLVLVGGDPGVGKSTLLLQVAGSLAALAAPKAPGIGMGPAVVLPNSTGVAMGPVWYVSGEETVAQVASRAARLGAVSDGLFLLAETYVDRLCQHVVEAAHPTRSDETTATPLPPSLLIVDSIQTMVCEAGGTSSAGGITQVRECVALLLRLAKTTHVPIFLVGHVTKAGHVAGPR
jgi:DNA repair protein RadA/Sms